LLWTVVWLGIGLTGQTAEGEKYPQPKTAELSRAEKLVDEVFGKDMAKARSAQEKAKLAQEILQSAREEQDMAVRFAALQSARRLAVEALDGKLGLEIVREIVQTYEPLEEMTKEDRLSEADRLWGQAEKAQGREKLAKQLEAVECWFYADIKTGLVLKKWEERIKEVKQSLTRILYAKDAKLIGQKIGYAPQLDCILQWVNPLEGLEWKELIPPGKYEVVCVYAADSKSAFASLFALEVGKSVLKFRLQNTGQWPTFSPVSCGTIIIATEANSVRLRVLQKVPPDPNMGIIALRSLCFYPVP
ncbi:MAG TPA: hypothetical protein PK777_09735, partial [Thermoguttaceae bacterium]|nr:hypothetical protein [Thermoguttaceae bacterium]